MVFSTQRANRLRKFTRRGATSPLTETPSLLAPNVSVSAKVSLQRVRSCGLSTTSLSTVTFLRICRGNYGLFDGNNNAVGAKRLLLRGVWPSRGSLVKEMSIVSCCPRHSHLPAERMTKEFTALAPSTIKIRQVHNFRTDFTSLTFDL